MQKIYKLLFLFLAAINVAYADNKVPVNNPAPRFTENKGQWNKNILYKLGLSNAHLYLEQNRFTWVFYSPEFLESIHPHGKREAFTGNNAFAYHVNFLNANAAATTSGKNAYADYSNYFIGSDEKNWASRVQSYNEVHYTNLYAGIDMNIYGKNGLLKYDFVVAKNIDASQIKMQYDGAEKLAIENGNLKVHNLFNTVTEHKPIAWQILNGKKVFVPCRFELSNNTVSFSFPNGYNTAYELVIDPQLEFSTYTGSTADNWGYSATYNEAGNFYAGGIAFAPGYPTTTGAYQTNFGGGPGGFPCDISLTKYTPDGSAQVYSTYLGGSGNEMPYSMFVNQNDEVFVFGATGSSNFPTTSGAYDQSFNGGTFTTVDNVIEMTNGSDIIVSRFSADGTDLLASTYVGGTGNDGLNIVSPLSYNYSDHARGEVFIDENGNAVIGSCTFSTDFPVTPGAFQQTYGGNQDGCLFRLDPTLSNLQWSTYFGGSTGDAIYSMKINSAGTVYVCGGTASSDFPSTPGVLHTAFQGGITDGFVAAFNPLDADMWRSSFIGTNQYDQSYFIEIDGDDDVYLYGQTLGAYPVTNGVYSNPGSKQYIHKMDSLLENTYFSTVFGDGGAFLNLSPTAFLVDVCEKIYIAGWGGTVNTSNGLGANLGYTNGLPTTSDGYQQTTDGSDFYFMVLEQDATALLYGTFFGGNGTAEHVDGGTSRFDKSGIIYEAVCAGCGGSDMFPTTPGAWSQTNNSSNCNLGSIKFRIQLSEVEVNVEVDNISSTGCAPFTVEFLANGVNAQGYYWDFGDGDTSTLEDPTHVYNDTGTYTVMVIGYDSLTCAGLAFLDTSYATITVLDGNVNTFAGAETSICTGDTIQLGATAVTGLTYQWTPALGLSDDEIANPLAFPDETTTYVLEASNPNCSGTDTVTITVVEKAPTDFTVELTPACEGVHAKFTNTTPDAVQYFWDFGGEATSTDANPEHNYDVFDNNDTITLITINSLGCADTLRFDTSGIQLINIFPDSIPNIFTPNGDALNECFITGIGTAYDECFYMIIYNRWGRKVFETDKSSDCWNGLYNDKRDADEGTYFYIIRIKEEEYHGFFQLKK
ncbi:MAG: gliding motility-associated C-terminal domain-containing protein [Bacteroidia bacterium]